MSEGGRGDRLARYVRQLGILGIEGQEALSRARVAVVGLGGLGSAAAYYLAAAGVGELVLVDGDSVELHNLNRQILYDESDVGLPKAVLAARRVRAFNPDVRVRPVQERLDSSNAAKLLGEVDVIVDGLDNWEARLALDEYAWDAGVPLVHAAVERWHGQLTVVKRGITGCLACLAPPRPRRRCVSIIGPAAGLVGLLEAMEAIKVVTGVGEPAYNKLVVIDAMTPSIDVVPLKPVPCEECRSRLAAGHSLAATPQARND